MFAATRSPGAHSDRLGTWSLTSFVLLFWAVLFLGPLVLIPAAVCAAATLGAVACGLVGLVSREASERRAAVQGLLKAMPAIVIGGWFALVLWSLFSGGWTFD